VSFYEEGGKIGEKKESLKKTGEATISLLIVRGWRRAARLFGEFSNFRRRRPRVTGEGKKGGEGGIDGKGERKIKRQQKRNIS